MAAARGGKGLWIWVAIFAVGFGLGYLLTTLAVSGPEEHVRETARSQDTARSPADAAPSKAPPAEALAEARGLTGMPAVPPPVAAPPPVTPQPAATKAPEAPSPPRGPTGAETPKPEDPAAPSDPAVQEPPPAEPPEVVDEQPARPWWQACRASICKVDFGAITGGLTIRRGHVVHGSRVDWQADFGGGERLSVLPTEGEIQVRVEGVGLAADGQPIAAEIVYRAGERELRGVIKLDLGSPDKRITMQPM